MFFRTGFDPDKCQSAVIPFREGRFIGGSLATIIGTQPTVVKGDKYKDYLTLASA
jgi:hypothetical protein